MSFLKFGVFLPAGARIVHPDNISIGRSFAMGPFSQLICQDADKGSRIILGHHVGLNHHVFINADCGGKIIFGDNVIVGPMTIFRAADHNFDDLNTPIRFQGHKAGCIRVEDDVWIGAGVFVLPDVTIGKGSVVGAGSVVTKDIPPYSIAVGNPARVIRKRS